MRRRRVRPFGTSIPASRGFSMLIGLAVLWVLFDTMRQPAHWNWLAADDGDAAVITAVPRAPGEKTADLSSPSPRETVVPGPNDLDPAVMAEFTAREELITDMTKLRPREMFAYWDLLSWSRSQSFAELEQRARKDPVLTQIWEEPKKHRGHPFRLKLHVRRVLEWDTDPKQNPLGVTKVYEAMGWTDESRSLPYTIVFLEKPAQLPIGSEVVADVEFVGYFLKISAYTAYDSTRGTPLLMGRVRMVPPPRIRPAEGLGPLQIGGLFVAGLFGLGLVLWFIPRKRRPVRSLAMTQTQVDPSWNPLESGNLHDPIPMWAAGANLLGETADNTGVDGVSSTDLTP
ncbi:MAG: hypothetical protein U0929_00395 [Planctomycetaceae bacterium]